MGVNITRQFPTHGPERPMVPSEAPRGATQGKAPRGAAQGKGDRWGSLDKALGAESGQAAIINSPVPSCKIR
jgi:hypothetical protein